MQVQQILQIFTHQPFIHYSSLCHKDWKYWWNRSWSSFSCTAAWYPYFLSSQTD